MSPQPAAHNPFVTAIALVVGVARRRRFRVALIDGFALEELFGPLERARVSTTGEHFDL